MLLLDETMEPFKLIQSDEIDADIKLIYALSETHDKIALILSTIGQPDKSRYKSFY